MKTTQPKTLAENPAAEPCCETVLLTVCCTPEERPTCCGDSPDASSCKCQPAAGPTR